MVRRRPGDDRRRAGQRPECDGEQSRDQGSTDRRCKVEDDPVQFVDFKALSGVRRREADQGVLSRRSVERLPQLHARPHQDPDPARRARSAHVHHLHAHQWLHSPNSPAGDYLDSQLILPGSAYTLEIAYNGSGNRNQTVGDSIFHCHFYPHFAKGMWSLWRVHDVFEAGTELDAAAACA